MTRTVAAAVLLALALALLPGAGAGAATRTGPHGDAFYVPPSPLPGKAHGDLVWARALPAAARTPGAGRAHLLLYRSAGVRGGAVAVSGVVEVPRGKAPRGGWPVVSWAHGTTGIADPCAPSRNLLPGGPAHRSSTYIKPLLSRWLKAGYAVVRSDFEGLGTPGEHPYLIGRSEGRGTLDVVRAARQLDRRIGRRLALAGHSQGGHAALWATALARRHTPELDLRATVAYAPASHLGDQLAVLNLLRNSPGGGLSALIAMIVRGIDVAEPGLGVAAALGERAAPLWPQTLERCTAGLAAPDSFGALPPADLLRNGPARDAFLAARNRNDPETLRPRTPVRIDQGAADTTVLPLFTDALIANYLDKRVPLTTKSYAGVDHAGIVAAAAAASTRWMARRLER